jgi:hypothetical protein
VSVDTARQVLRRGQAVCLTGRMRYQRADLERAMRLAGLTPEPSVRHANVLVAQQLSSASAKATAMRAAGGMIFQADEFIQALITWSPEADDYLEAAPARF